MVKLMFYLKLELLTVNRYHELVGSSTDYTYYKICMFYEKSSITNFHKPLKEVRSLVLSTTAQDALTEYTYMGTGQILTSLEPAAVTQWWSVPFLTRIARSCHGCFKPRA